MAVEREFFGANIDTIKRGFIWAKPPKAGFWRKLWDSITWVSLIFDYFPEKFSEELKANYSSATIPGLPFQPMSYINTSNKVINMTILLNKFPPTVDRKSGFLVWGHGPQIFSVGGATEYLGAGTVIRKVNNFFNSFSPAGQFLLVSEPKDVNAIVYQRDDVTEEVQFLESLMYPSDDGSVITDEQRANPPIAHLQISRKVWTCVLKDMKVDYLLFDQKTSQPLRAKIDLTFEEFKSEYTTYSKIIKELKK